MKLPPNLLSYEHLYCRPEYGFDYKEEEERPAYVPKVSSAKKTPISGIVIFYYKVLFIL